MKYILKISPSFLQKLDTYLRINYPWIWATRIHLNIYLALLIFIVFAIVGLLVPVEFKNIPGQEFIGKINLILFIPALTWLIFLLRQLALYNVDKFFGIQKRFREIMVFLIYFITFSLPLGIFIFTTLIIDIRIDNIISDEDLNTDQFTYATGYRYYPDNSYNWAYFPSDSLYLLYQDPDYHPERYLSDIETSENAMADSIFYHKGVFENRRPHLYYTDYNYSYNSYKNSHLLIDSLIEQYHKKYNVTRDMDVAFRDIEKFKDLLLKYSYADNFDSNHILEDYKQNNYSLSYANNKLTGKISYTKENLNNLEYIKSEKLFYYQYSFWVFVTLLIFFITVLYNIFKQVSLRQFLLSLSVLAIISTILGIFQIIAITKYFFISSLFWICIFMIIYFFVKYKSKTYNIVTNQISILLAMLMPVLGIITLSYMANVFDFFQSSLFDSYKVLQQDGANAVHYVYTPEYYKLEKSIWSYTMWIGLLVYLFVWNILLKKAFLHMWNLPKPS